MMHITRRFRRDPIVGECGAVLDETDAYTADMVVYRRALERLEGCVGCASAMLVHADPDGRVDQDGEVLPELRRAEIAAAVAMTRAGDAERACANEMDAVYDGPGAAIEEAAEQALLRAGRAHAAAHRCRAAAARSRAGRARLRRVLLRHRDRCRRGQRRERRVREGRPGRSASWAPMDPTLAPPSRRWPTPTPRSGHDGPGGPARPRGPDPGAGGPEGPVEGGGRGGRDARARGRPTCWTSRRPSR